MRSKEIEDAMSAFMDATYDHLYLPSELIGKIFSFIIVEHCDKIIYKHCSNYINLKKYIAALILYCLPNVDATIDSASIGEISIINISRTSIPSIIIDPLDALKFIVGANITRKYDLNLWANILQSLSVKINKLRFYQRANNIGKKSQYGKKLAQMTNLWLQLCKKFNFKLFLQTNKFEKYVRARSIIKINNFDKYLITPIIMQPFQQFGWIDNENASNMLVEYLNIYGALGYYI